MTSVPMSAMPRWLVGSPVSYASVAHYVQQFGIAEAAQLLCDEEPLLTEALLTDLLAGDVSAYTPEEQQAANNARQRLQDMLQETINYINSFLRKAVNLPLSQAQIDQTPLRTCCVELTRCQLADDADNGTDPMNIRCKRWVQWLKDVAAGRLALLADDEGVNVANGYRVGCSTSQYNWNAFGGE